MLPGLFFSAAATFLCALPYRARAGPSTANDAVSPLSGPETLFRHFDEEIRKNRRFFSRGFQQGNFSKVRGNFRKLHPLKRKEREIGRKVTVLERKVTLFRKKVSYKQRTYNDLLRLGFVSLRFGGPDPKRFFLWSKVTITVLWKLLSRMRCSCFFLKLADEFCRVLVPH